MRTSEYGLKVNNTEDKFSKETESLKNIEILEMRNSV